MKFRLDNAFGGIMLVGLVDTLVVLGFIGLWSCTSMAIDTMKENRQIYKTCEELIEYGLEMEPLECVRYFKSPAEPDEE